MVEKSISDRIEDAIERLTAISSDLSKMLAVQEQRLNHQERQVNNLEETIEKRREESEIKLRDVYETIRNEDRSIIEEITKLREEATAQHTKLTQRMADMEKTIWMYMGGFTAVFFLLSYGQNILKLFIK